MAIALTGVPLLLVVAALELLQAADPYGSRRSVLRLRVLGGLLLVLFVGAAFLRLRQIL